MASGKQSKRRRAAQTPPPVRSTARKRKASPRVLAVGAAAIVLVVAAIVLGSTLGDGSDDAAVPTHGSLTNALPGAAETQELLKGIPQSGNVLGEPAAAVTVIEYVDPQCPFCRQFEAEAMPTLIERYVRTGKAKIELRPLAFIGPDSARGRAAMVAGGEQNKMFNVAELLYLNQSAENSGWLSDDLVANVAASIPGVDVTRFLEDVDDPSVADKASSFDADATTDAVSSTPTILVGRSGEDARVVQLADATDAEAVARAIDSAMR